ncbi:MAG: hypothetical protein E7548_06900 [Ruminococcaceae bacterium]|nr:hypothetical protein [Oscillospiraceae bacterium]
MKKCPYCSAEILDNAEFCLHCMKQLNKKQAVPSKSFFPKKRIIWIVAVVLLFSLIPLCLFLGNGEKEVASSGVISNYSGTVTSNSSTHSASVSNASQTFSSGNVIISGSGGASISGSGGASISGGGTSEISVGGSSASSTSSGSTSHGASSSSSAGGGTTSTSSDTVSSKIEYVADPSILTFEENPTGYTVTGFASEFEPCHVLVFPKTYNGKPVTKIGDSAFYGEYNLYSVSIPDSVTDIGDQAFANCGSLTIVDIGDGVINIGFAAFDVSNSLETVILGNSVANIEHFAFWDCLSLTSITIPKNVKILRHTSLGGCTSITDVFYEGTIAEWQTLQKNSLWNNAPGYGNYYYDFIVHCSDGDTKP